MLVSGGMDSATVLALAREEGYACHALSVDYGQRHRLELDMARRLACELGAVEHRVFRLDLAQFGGSALTDSNIPVPESSREALPEEIPVTYVPARNTIFLALALGWAEVLDCGDIFIGANAVDYSGYPDCRPEFIEAFARTARLATRRGVQGAAPRIHAPLMSLGKADIVRLGARLGLDYAMTVSCYRPDERGRACGRCDACHLRRRGFREAGLADPAPYATEP